MICKKCVKLLLTMKVQSILWFWIIPSLKFVELFQRINQSQKWHKNIQKRNKKNIIDHTSTFKPSFFPKIRKSMRNKINRNGHSNRINQLCQPYFKCNTILLSTCYILIFIMTQMCNDHLNPQINNCNYKRYSCWNCHLNRWSVDKLNS